MFGVLKDYIFWHYTVAYVDQIYILKNYVWFLKRFFSIREVVKSLFSPWKRIQDDKGSLLRDPGNFFASLIVNTIMRIVGFFARMILLLIALICFLVLLVIALIVMVLWALIPLIVVFLFGKGVTLLFT